MLCVCVYFLKDCGSLLYVRRVYNNTDRQKSHKMKENHFKLNILRDALF